MIGLLWPLPDAFAATGVRALDEPAILVKAPDRAFLTAITEAGNRMVAVGEHGVVIYSDDDGANWKQGNVPVSVFLSAVSFATPAIGWAVGHYGVILHTTDGGRDWKEELNGLQANQLSLAAAQTAVAANDPSIGTPLALKRANRFVASGPDKPFLSLWTPNAHEAIAFGAYRLTMKTIDGGKNWTDWDLHIGDPLSHNLYDATIVGTQIFVAAETGIVFCSTDGGVSFPQVTQPGNATLFGAIATGDGGVLVFGVAGQAFRSNDGGHTWQQVTFPTAGNLTSATRLRDGSIVVAGEDGAVYLSLDHGHEFRLLPTQMPMAVFDLTQAHNGDLIVVGNAGVMRIPAQALNLN